MKINRVTMKIAAVMIGVGVTSFWNSFSFAMPLPYAGMEALALSPDGQVVAISQSGRHRKVKVWNVQERFSYPGASVAQSDQLKFSADSRFLQTTTQNRIGRWEITTGKLQASQPSRIDHSQASAISPDWQQTARFDFSKYPYELEVGHAGQVVWRASPVEPQSVLAFSLDGQKLACIGSVEPIENKAHPWSKNLFLRLFDVRSGGLLRSVPVGEKKALKASFLSDGQELAVVFADSRVTIFDVESAQEVKSFVIPPHPASDRNQIWEGKFDFSPDGETLVSLNKEIQLWNVRQGTSQATLQLPAPSVISKTSFSADKKTFAVDMDVPAGSYGARQPCVYVWNVEDGQLLSTFY